MNARILNGTFQGVYNRDFFEEYWDVVINGQLVSEWEVTDILPTEAEKQYIKSMFADGAYYEGATEEEIEAIEEAKIPTKLRNFQIREGLIEMGIMPSAVDAEIEKLPSPDKDIVSQMWNFRDEISRNNPYVIQLASVLNIDLKQLYTISNLIN